MHPRERVALIHDIQYTQLYGDIGMVSNGGGLCMAMCDLVTQFGGKPANFSDLGGNAIHEQIQQLLTLM